jgi:hypothetical protein
MQIPAGKIYDLLLGIALRMRKGAEHAMTGAAPDVVECAFSASGGEVVQMNFAVPPSTNKRKTVIPAKVNRHKKVGQAV